MATFALFSWPLIAIALFNAFGRMKGVIWGILIPALTLPEQFVYDLPALPPYDKEMAIVVGLLLGLLASKSDQNNAPVPVVAAPGFKNLIYGLSGLLLFSALLSVLFNTEPLSFGPTRLPALGLRDLISMVFASLVFLTMYFIAQHHLSTSEAHVEILKALVVAGLFYTLPILFEVRMSPQLHTWVYGFFQHSWGQHIRGGYFRPIVFMPHGIWIGILLTCCSMAAFVLLKQKVKAGAPRLQYFAAGLWLFGVLSISRNFGASALALVFVPILWFLGYKLQVWIAIAIMALFLIHPAMRQAKLVTFENLAERIGEISIDRQQSFEFRLDNENSMLERASIKSLTGWGVWSRWRVYDPVTGEDTSIVDGRWIIVLGERGWIGFVAYFGLLTLPTFMVLRAARRRELTHATAGLSLIMAAIMVYQIPNDTIGPLVLIIAGALSGFVMYRPPDDVNEPEAPPDVLPPRKNPYTRFPSVALASDPGQSTGHMRTRLVASDRNRARNDQI